MLQVAPKAAPLRSAKAGPSKQERARKATLMRLAFFGVVAVVLLLVVGGVLKWTGRLPGFTTPPQPNPNPNPAPGPNSSDSTTSLTAAGPLAFLTRAFTKHTGVSVLVVFCSQCKVPITVSCRIVFLPMMVLVTLPPVVVRMVWVLI